MDACEIANILAKELWLHQLATLDGLNSGVPTRTTATLTPTTLRSIEQTFIELQSQTEQHQNQAGFVPPSVVPTNIGTSQSVGFAGGSLRISPGPGSSSDSGGPSSSPAPSLSPATINQSSNNNNNQPPTRRRGMGGRKPAHAQTYLSPEEEERRNVRRERNKMAAARCRKRRLDHTNELEEETKGLERKKQILQDEIRQLQSDREELEFLLQTHRACCRMQANVNRRSNECSQQQQTDQMRATFRAAIATENKNGLAYPPIDNTDGAVRIKEEVIDAPISMDNDVFTSPQLNKRVMLSSANPQVVAPVSSSGDTSNPPTKPNRPNFLNVPISLTPAQAHNLKNNGNLNEVAGIAITTPSNGIPFNFDSLMEGGTGLTPVQPCATQQQKSQPEIGSPDSINSSKLG